MNARRSLQAVALTCAIVVLGACQVLAPSPPPPPPVRPVSFIPLGINAPYLSADVIGGRKARAAKMKAAKIKPLSTAGAYTYMTELDGELRRQTAGIGLDVIGVAGGIVVRIPATFTFDPGSATVKPKTDTTLLEIARTVKSRNQTFVDVLAHTDTTGTPQVNQALSDKRAAAVATYLVNHGVAKARVASKGYGETAPLYRSETGEDQRAANRRIEIRLVPYTG